MHNSFWRQFLVILVLAALLRLIFLAVIIPHPERTVRRDTPTYVRPAENILNGLPFSEPGIECARRTPVYPLFLAAVFKVLGHSLLAVAAVQIMLSVLSVALLFFLARLFAPERAALFAALLFALSLNSIVYSIYILSETLFTLLFLSMVFVLVVFAHRQNLQWIFIAGIFTGLAILCRPLGQFLPVVITGWILLIGGNFRNKIKTLVLYLLPILLLVLPWMVRNQKACGTFTISTISSYNLLFTYAVALEADLTDQNEETIREKIRQKFMQTMSPPTKESDAARAARLQKEWAWEIIKKHPFRYAKIHLAGLPHTFLPNITDLFEIAGATDGGKGTLAILNRDGLFAAVRHYFSGRIELLFFAVPFVLVLFTTYLCMIFGFFRSLSRQKFALLFLLIVPSLLLLISSGPASVPRFRAPVMPIICLFAGIGLDALVLKYKVKNH
ncbi:MAG TPA: glycosyltransferase family 39 protein [bacterium]|nr:glycosyltransferase family 39 protein [bacterium]